jgi:ribosomal protein S18 acetylase RimI-like enzyme
VERPDSSTDAATAAEKEVRAETRQTPKRRLRSIAVRLMLRLQGSRRYRRLARVLAGDCTVTCATEGERPRLAERRPETGHPESGPHADVMAFVAERRGRIVGWAYLVVGDAQSRFPGPWLFRLHVVGRYRGTGIGERLARRAVESGRAQDFDYVSLMVNESNVAASMLYRRLGFVVADDALSVARMDEAFRRYGVRRLVMRAPLS